jgi:aryl-alcohol dehydrogenase-like predicted oxidoreductase
MEFRRLGKSGLQVSTLSFGAWVTFGTQLDVDGALELMSAAYDNGCNFFDNAEVYARGQAETIMGEALTKAGWRRDSYIVSSKVFGGAIDNPSPIQRGLSRKHVFEACHQAIKRLQCEYLDLYFCHRPDRSTPIEETVRAMTELIHRAVLGHERMVGARIDGSLRGCTSVQFDSTNDGTTAVQHVHPLPRRS